MGWAFIGTGTSGTGTTTEVPFIQVIVAGGTGEDFDVGSEAVLGGVKANTLVCCVDWVDTGGVGGGDVGTGSYVDRNSATFE